MTKIITLNQLLKLMEDFQTTHPLLKDFGFGPTHQIGTSRQMSFPYMWSTFEQDSIISLTNKTAIPTLNFTIIFADKINNQKNFDNNNGEDSNNGQEILSDTFQIAQDFVTHIGTAWRSYGITISNDQANIFAVEDETDDKVNGWGLRIGLKLIHSNCSYDV